MKEKYTRTIKFKTMKVLLKITLCLLVFVIVMTSVSACDERYTQDQTFVDCGINATISSDQENADYISINLASVFDPIKIACVDSSADSGGALAPYTMTHSTDCIKNLCSMFDYTLNFVRLDDAYGFADGTIAALSITYYNERTIKVICTSDSLYIETQNNRYYCSDPQPIDCAEISQFVVNAWRYKW